MDSAQLIIEKADQARFIILVTNLCVLIPLSFYEIGYLQKFKVDRLFLFTCVLYSSCFSLRLIYQTCFEKNYDQTNFEFYFLGPFISTIQGLACLCLTYYILIIEFVKITIESMSPQILRKSKKKHTQQTWMTLSFLFLLLIIQTIMEKSGELSAELILNFLYYLIISVLCIRFIWIAKYFIDKKQEVKLQRFNINNNESFIDLKLLLIWTIIALNTITQLARVFVGLPLIIVSFGGLQTQSGEIFAAKSIILALSPLVDMITVLSLLYVYHILGLKKRRLQKCEGHYSIDGLVNTIGGGQNEEIINGQKEYSNKLTQNYSSVEVTTEDQKEGPQQGAKLFKFKFEMQNHEIQKQLFDEMSIFDLPERAESNQFEY